MQRKLTAVLALLCSLVAPAAAQQPGESTADQMGPRDLIDVNQVLDVQLAPDGTRLLYEVRRTLWDQNRYVTELWLAPLEPAGKPVRLLTSQATTSAFRSLEARWSPDSRRVAYYSDRSGSNQIWLLDPSTRSTQPLTKIAKWQAVDPRAVQPAFFRWSPNGRAMAFAASRAVRPPASRDLSTATTGRSVGVDWTKENQSPGERTATNATIWLVDLASGQTRRLTGDSLHVVDLAWSPDGTRLAFSATGAPEEAPYKTELYLLDVQSAGIKSLVTQPGFDNAPEWSPDGEWIAFESQRGEQDWNYSAALAVVPVSGGSPRYLAPEFDQETGSWPHRQGWSADSRGLYFSAFHRLGQHLFLAPIDGRRAERVSGGTRFLDHLSLAPARSKIAFTQEDVVTPPDVYLDRLDSTVPRQPTRVTDLNPEWGRRPRPLVDTVAWRSRDGRFEIEGVVLKPPGYDSATAYPMLVFIEGGPSPIRAGFQLDDPPAYPLLAWVQRGYVVFVPGSRGRTGYGAAYRQAMPERSDFLPGAFGDVMAGIDHLVRVGLADSSRLGLMGFSYGGCLTAYAITRTTRFRAASINEGCGNFVRYAFSVAGQRDRVEILADQAGFGSPWHPDSLRTMVEQSAMYRMDRVRTPTLLEYGVAALAEPEGKELFGALQRFGVPSQFIVYPRTGHGVEEPVLREDSFRRNLAWFDYWVLGRGPNPMTHEPVP